MPFPFTIFRWVLRLNPSLKLPLYYQRKGGLRYLNRWFIKLRFFAVVATALGTLIAVKILHLLEDWVLLPLLFLSLMLLLTNILYIIFLSRKGNQDLMVLRVQMWGDLLFLYLFFLFSGGLANPLVVIFLIHVVLGIVLFPPRTAWIITLVILVEYLLLFLSPYLFTALSLPLLKGFHLTLNALWVILVALTLITLGLHTFVSQLVNLARHYEDLHFSSLCMKTCPWIAPFQQLKGNGYAVLTEDLRLLWASPGFKEIESSYSSVLLPSLRDGAKKISSGMKFPHFLEKRLELQGETRFYTFSLFPIVQDPFPANEVEKPSWVLFFQDITEKKIIEHKLLEEDRLSTLGLLTAGVIHEIGNPMSSLATRVHLLSQTQEPQKLKEGVTQISKEIERLNRLIRQLSHINRSQGQALEPIRVQGLVEYVVEILKVHPLGKKMRWRLEAPPYPLYIQGSFSELCQALLNVGLNAVEASPPGAEIYLEIKSGDDRVIIEVQDCGKGIPSEIQARIYDPFFTTKTGGTGLGLFLTRKIVEIHRGEIRFLSTPQGTTFILTFPRLTHGTPVRGEDRVREVYDTKLPG